MRKHIFASLAAALQGINWEVAMKLQSFTEKMIIILFAGISGLQCVQPTHILVCATH